MVHQTPLHIGTCSWKYDSWRGLIYPEGPVNFLKEYSKHYRTVEIDQWFWSLFKGDSVALPQPDVVREYAASVPPDFIFGIKVPNSITLTHHYSRGAQKQPQANPYFLDVDLMNRFLESIEPLHSNLGPLMFQFEYLNRQKMASLQKYIDLFGAFTEKLPADFTYTVEIRNKNFLQPAYFDLLESNKLHHVFLHGYYMPPIFDVYQRFREKIRGLAVIRLHGPGRSEIEKKTGKDWSHIVEPQNRDIDRLVDMVADLGLRTVETFVYVNNHFEGSAPITIRRIEERQEHRLAVKK